MPYKNREQRLEAQKKHYENNKEKYRCNQYLRRMKKAEWFFEFKTTLNCSECGESHPACLQFHHRNPLEKEGDVSGFVRAGYSKDIIMREIEKCDVLCANCHLRKHWQQRVDEGAAEDDNPMYLVADE
jgi:5-methylcytosine-specific restriction endonuclease McrA